MRRSLFWKEMRELAQILAALAVFELVLGIGFWRLPAGAISDGFLAGLFFFAAAAVGTSLLARDRRPGTFSLLLSLPIPRRRILAAKLAAGAVSLLLVAAGGLALGGFAVWWGWIWGPGLKSAPFWWAALFATAFFSFLVAVRMALDWPEPLLPVVVGGGLGSLAFRVLWVDTASPRHNAMALLAALCAIGLGVWRLQARFEAVEDRPPRRSRDLGRLRRASPRRAPGLMAVEWRQKRSLLGILAAWPLLHLAGAKAGWLEEFSLFGWAWLSGAVVGASLFTARERDASRCLLHMLPIGRMRLAARRLLGGLAVGGLYLAEYLLVLRAEGALRMPSDLSFVILVFVFFYGAAFLIGSALSPWLRSTVATALLALVSAYLVLLLVMLYRFSLDDFTRTWTSTGLALAALAVVAGWSTMRSRAFEPAPRKDLRVFLAVFAVWLAIAAIVYGTAA